MIGSYKPWMKVVSSILLVIGGIFAAFPILWMVCSSFKANEAIFSWPPKFIDKTAGVHAYLEVLTDPEKSVFHKQLHCGGLCGGGDIVYRDSGSLWIQPV
ncbi:hypothetical protein [Suipraeoptans intestinalis]|uniref:hypothetical protein n=1 Tax=Suipraeoptans intestinalis TaxID=2606628 RepID=UPI002ED012A3